MPGRSRFVGPPRLRRRPSSARGVGSVVVAPRDAVRPGVAGASHGGGTKKTNGPRARKSEGRSLRANQNDPRDSGHDTQSGFAGQAKRDQGLAVAGDIIGDLLSRSETSRSST